MRSLDEAFSLSLLSGLLLVLYISLLVLDEVISIDTSDSAWHSNLIHVATIVTHNCCRESRICSFVSLLEFFVCVALIDSCFHAAIPNLFLNWRWASMIQVGLTNRGFIQFGFV